MRQQESSKAMDDMVHQAEQLSAHQQDFQNRLRQHASGAGSREQAQQLAGEKEKMADDLKSLEHQMSDTARQTREDQPGVSTKLREALAGSQQNEIGLKMKKNADYIRQGQGSYAWMREQTISQGLNDLKDKLKDAQASLQQGNGPGKNGKDKSDTERALAQVEAARNRLEQATQGRGRQPGQQQGQSGQQGKPGNQPGQQPGGDQPGGQQQGGQQQGGQSGNLGAGPFGGYGPASGMNDAIRDLSQVRQRLQTADPDASKEAQQLLQQLQGLNMANANDKELADRIQREVLPQLERLELQLRRQLDDKDAGQVRTGGADQVPTGYADAVAEYFRKLSKGK
jgi:hypothetical protein